MYLGYFPNILYLIPPSPLQSKMSKMCTWIITDKNSRQNSKIKHYGNISAQS